MPLDFSRPRRTTTHSVTGTDPKAPDDPSRTRTVTIASASIIRPSQLRRSSRKTEWQEDAWKYRRTVPELGFAIRWLSKAVGKCNLFLGEMPETGIGDPIPAKNPPQAAIDLLAELHGGPLGQKAALRRMAVHLSVPGETYSIRLDPPPSDPDGAYRWYVASDREFTSSGGKATLRLPEDGSTIELDLDPDTANASVIRMWQQDDEYAWEADSSIRANLGVLGVIEGLHRRVKVDIDSRLAGAGILFVPNSASMPNPKQSDSDDAEPLHSDPFINALMTGMIMPIQDPDDVSAIVPLVAKVPDEAIGKIQHISFATKFDEKLIENLESNLKRFAIGADLPAEIVTGGLADANHWSGWLIDETGVRLYVAPLGGVIASAWTQEYLWAGLRAAGVPNPEHWVIGLDTSELEQRPNKSAEANTLHDKGKLSDAALVRENGFGEEDLPDKNERQRWLAERIVLAHPQYLPMLAPLLGFPEVISVTPIDGTVSAPGLPSGESGDNTRPEIPEQDSQPPALTSSGDARARRWMVKTCETIALRAMELAGKRLLNTGGRGQRHRAAPGRQVEAWNIHTTVPRPVDDAGVDVLLAGAFTACDVLLPGEECIRSAIDTYCRALLMSGNPHSPEALDRVLIYAGCTAA